MNSENRRPHRKGHDLSWRRGKLDFGPGTDYDGEHFRLESSSPVFLRHYDVLLFTDSRGSAVDRSGGKTWPDLLRQAPAFRQLSCLYVARPKLTTTIFSLINFLRLNRITFNFLLTNTGFVDVTPSKRQFIDEMMQQLPDRSFGEGVKARKIGDHTPADSRSEKLYAMHYSHHCRAKIADEIADRFDYALLSGVLEFNSKIVLPRKRPGSFYQQLIISNRHLFEITSNRRNLHYIQPLCYQQTGRDLLSYDAVHLTELGHRMSYEALLPLVKFAFCCER